MIPRPQYTEKLLSAQDPEIVKILTGVRRCGKSSLLKILKENLMATGVPSDRFIEINFEFASFQHLQDPPSFHRYIRELLTESATTYLFIDEVQELDQWAKTINELRAEFDIDIFVTGSNSRMFVGEHLTYLSGRYIRIEVFPLSFREYLVFRNTENELEQKDIIQHYSDFITYGSLPAVALAQDPNQAHSLLDGLYDSIFTRDIILRGKIRNEAAFIRVMKFVLDNIGSQTSAHNIAEILKKEGHPISSDTIDNHLELMCKAYLLYQCDRYSIRGKERLKTNGKYYVVDNGLRNRALGYPKGNHGHITENTIFMELRRRGYEVSVGMLPQNEIDFFAKRHTEQAYIQVCETVLDPKTLDRELAPFKKLNDGYPRVLITKDYEDYSFEGIRHINFYDFLLGAEW